MDIRQHFVDSRGVEDKFECSVTRQDFDSGPQFRLRLKSSPEWAETFGIPTDVIDLMLSDRQRRAVIDQLSGWGE